MSCAQCSVCGVPLSSAGLPSGMMKCVYCAGLMPRPMSSAELLDKGCRDAIEVGREQFARKTQEACHVCGVKRDADALTICEPDRKGADALACCEGCARNRVPVGAVRGSSTFWFDPARAVPTCDGYGKPEPKRYVPPSAFHLLATWCDKCGAQCFADAGLRPRHCNACRAVSKVEIKVRGTTAEELERFKALMREGPTLVDQFADAIKAESVPPDVAGRSATVDLVDRHFQALRLDMERLLPDGRGKSVALTQLDTARLWALSVAGEVKP